MLPVIATHLTNLDDRPQRAIFIPESFFSISINETFRVWFRHSHPMLPLKSVLVVLLSIRADRRTSYMLPRPAIIG